MNAIFCSLALICPSYDAVFVTKQLECIAVCINGNGPGPCEIGGEFTTACFDHDGTSLCDAEFIEVDDE